MDKIIAFIMFVFSHNTNSAQWALNKKDLLKGLAVAVLSPLATVAMQTVESFINTPNGHVVIDWHSIALVASAAFVAYLSKNFISTQPK